ncbi:unnamed protein product [Mytilus coruscus]|uniref:B box-type domain-containing protein n=1 Tax=Mytilus coruscus TaxID=42192 RepID=A0A6J8DLQ2_MYTCO|nr:unnamed protein product [Mytilus coruscus]
MCEDRHENVFVADKNNNSVALFTSDGHYVRDILTSKEEINGPKSLTIDGRGYLRELPVPKEGIESVPFFPFTTKSNSVEKNEPERTCEMCDEIEIHSRCIDCDQNMCKSCHDYHLRNKIFRKHKLVEENTELPTKQEEMPLEDIQCSEHVKEFSFYCKSCNSAICEDCKKSKHFFHKTEYLDYAVKNMILSLTSLITSLNSKLPFLDNTIENAKTEKKKKNTRHIEQTKTELQRAASNLKEWMCTSVDMILSDSLQSLETLSHSDKKNMLAYIEEAELHRIAIIKFKKTIEGIVNCGIKCKIVEFSSAICRQSKIYDENYSLSGMMLKYPKYNPGTLSFNHIKDFFGSVEADENTTVLPTVHFPCLQTNDFFCIRTFTQEFKFEVESCASKLMTAGGSDVCVTHESYASDTRNYHGKVIVYDLSGKSKVNSIQCVSGRDKLEFIVVNTEKSFHGSDQVLEPYK